VPVITVKAGLEVLVFFGLEEVVVVSALGQVIHIIICAVVADLFGGGTEGIFVFADQLGIIGLFGFEKFDGTVGFEELHFKLANLGRWEVIVSREDQIQMLGVAGLPPLSPFNSLECSSVLFEPARF
jgi:hypothetical protein